MKRFFIILNFIVLTFASNTKADDLSSFWIMTNENITSQFSDEEIKKALTHNIWTKKKEAMAACFNSLTSTKCFVFIGNNKKYQVIDITQKFKASLGKITIHKDKFTKYRAFPLSFIKEDTGYLIKFKTQAWIQTQRNTVQWTMYLKKDGTPVYQ